MSSKAKLILIGSGGHSRSCIDTIEQEAKYSIAGLVGLKDEIGSFNFGYEVIATDSELSELAKNFPYAIIGVGQINSSNERIRLYHAAINAGFALATVISPFAYVSPRAKIGSGTIVMNGSIINAGVTVGENCIINSLALLEHDSQVENHCHISTGAILNGSTVIRMGSFIGSGTILKEGISIGQNCIVGMGLSVRNSLKDDSRFLGEEI